MRWEHIGTGDGGWVEWVGGEGGPVAVSIYVGFTIDTYYISEVSEWTLTKLAWIHHLLGTRQRAD